VTAGLLLMLAAGFAVRDGRLGVLAADDETITWLRLFEPAPVGRGNV
jgi:hypothetical protein